MFPKSIASNRRGRSIRAVSIAVVTLAVLAACATAEELTDETIEAALNGVRVDPPNPSPTQDPVAPVSSTPTTPSSTPTPTPTSAPAPAPSEPSAEGGAGGSGGEATSGGMGGELPEAAGNAGMGGAPMGAGGSGGNGLLPAGCIESGAAMCTDVGCSQCPTDDGGYCMGACSDVVECAKANPDCVTVADPTCMERIGQMNVENKCTRRAESAGMVPFQHALDFVRCACGL